MKPSKTFFQQIPVEAVKQIATEFPDHNAVGSQAEGTARPNPVSSPGDSWRDLALKVQQERDPKRMIELVKQLIATLDQDQLGKGAPRDPNAGNHSE